MPKFIVTKKVETRDPLRPRSEASQKPETSYSPDTLIPTNQVITLAKSAGVDFGPGNPNERIRYFIKLGILPHALRKAPTHLPTDPPTHRPNIVGHLPYWTVKRLIFIQRQNKIGLSYPQIAAQIKQNENKEESQQTAPHTQPQEKPIVKEKPKVILVQKVGLDGEQIKQKLKEHESKVQQIIKDEIASSNTLGAPQQAFSQIGSQASSNLLPTEEVIKRAKDAGINFGNGNPNERIRYFIKLGILPHTVRKTVDQGPGTRDQGPVGHLPEWTIKRLIYINKLHQNGLTYPLIAQKIKKLEERRLTVSQKEQKDTQTKTPFNQKSAINLFPHTGLSEREISRRLQVHERNIINHIDKRLGIYPQPAPVIDANLADLEKTPPTKLVYAFKGLIVITTLTGFLAVGIFSANDYINNIQDGKKVSKDISSSSNLLGQVLAASSDDHRFYIDADTQVSGTTLFAENITAPNVLYGAVGGTAITVSAGQTPTISLDTSGVVTSVNDLAGALTLKASGSASISKSGSTITISSTDTGETDTTLSENDVEGYIFDADAQSITGIWEVQDDINFAFGNDANWSINYDESVDDQLLFETTNTSATAIGDALIEFLFDSDTANGTGLTANQQVFSLAKGTQAANTELLTVDEDGDAVFAGDITVNSCTGCGGSQSLDQAYDNGGTIQIDSNTPVIITETTAAANTGDLLQLTNNTATGGTTSGDALQITLDGVDANANSGNGINIVVDQSQNTGNAILVQDDAAATLFQLDEDGALTFGTVGSTTAITITDTDYTNALSIGDNNITGTTFSLTGTTAVIDFTDFDVDSDGLTTIAPDGTGVALQINLPNNTTQGIAIDAATNDNTGTSGVVDIDVDTTSSQAGIDMDLETITDSGVDTVSGVKITATQTSTDNDVIYGIHVADLAGTADSGNEYAVYQAGTSWDYGGYFEDDVYFATDITIAGGNLNFGAATTIGDGGDAIAFSLLDNTTDALDIQEGTNNYININTTNSSENIAFGNSTTNPSYSFLGSGNVTIAGNLDLEGYGAFGNGSALSADSGLIVDYDATYTGTGQQLLVKGTVTGAANTNVYGTLIDPESITIPTGTTTLAASLYLDEPNITETGTLTSSASLYVAATATEGTANYGIYSTATTASTNYALYTGNGNVSHILGASDKVYIDATTTANTGTAGVLDIDVTSLTHQNSGLNLAYTSTAAGAATTIDQYGIYSTLTSTQAVTATSPAFIYYGLYQSVAKSGADNLTTDGTFNSYGSYVTASNTSTDAGATGTRNTYGGYFSATGGAASGDRAYGIYTTAASADTNYSIYSAAGNIDFVIGGTENFYIDANSGGSANHNFFEIDVNFSDNGTYEEHVIALNIQTGNPNDLNDSSDSIIDIYFEEQPIGDTADINYQTGLRIFVEGPDGDSFGTNLTNGILIESEGSQGIITDAIDVSNADIVNALNLGANTIISDDIDWVLSTSGQINIDASSTANTGNTGVLDIDIGAGNSNVDGINLSLTVNDGASGGRDFEGIVIDLTVNDANADLFGLVINAAATTNAAAGSYEALIKLVNAENTASTVTDAILVDSTSGTAGDIVDGLDVSDANITNALNVGSNFILFDGIQAFEGTTGTLTIEDTSGNDLITIVDTGTAGDLDITGDLDIDGHSTFGDQAGSPSSIVALHMRERFVSSDDCGIVGCYGALLRTESTSAGGTNPYLIAAYFQNIINSGTIANSYALYADNASNSGTLTNNYGIYVADQTSGGTTDYGIYVAGADTAAAVFDDPVLMDVNAGVSTEGLCHSGSDAAVDKVEIYDCSSDPIGDYAEVYPTENGTEFGDVLVTGTETVYIKGADGYGHVLEEVSEPIVKLVKSSSRYQKNIIGIASNNFHEWSSIGHDRVDETDHPLPVALSGRVPVKVTDENGPINVGDLLTTSSTLSHGMRADPEKGSTFAKALTSFSGPGEGEVLAFIEINTRYNLKEALADIDLTTNTLSTSSISLTNSLVFSEDIISEDGTLNEEITDQVLTAQQIQRLVELEVEKQLTSYQLPVTNNQIDNPVLQDSTPNVENPDTQGVNSNEATDSAQLADETQQTLDELDELLSTTHLSLDTLTVIGNTQLASTQVAGTFSQDGTLIIDYGKQINVLGSTLYLQNDPLAGDCQLSDVNCQLLDIGAGKVTIDKEGNLILKGSLKAERLTTNELEINTSDVNSQTVGTASINAGQSQITIATTAIKPNAKILITPTTPTDGKVLYISQQTDFEGFTIALDSGSASQNIQFNWFIVMTSQISEAN